MGLLAVIPVTNWFAWSAAEQMTAKLKRAKGQHGDMNLRDQPDNSISTEYPFTRGWLKFEIKTTIVARSMLPDMYFLI